MLQKLRNDKKGSMLLEALLAIALLLIIVTPLINLALVNQENINDTTQFQKATLYAQEGLEATRAIRNNDFSLLQPGSFGVSSASGVWEFISSPQNIDHFTRTLTIESVNDNLMEIESRVTWMKKQREREVVLSTYLVNPNTPLESIYSPTIASCFDLSGGQDALRAVRQGNFAYIITDSASESFVVYDITDPYAPVEIHRVNLHNNPRELTVVGNYAYIASKHNTQELQIIDISDPYTADIVGSYDAPGQGDMSSIAVVGGKAYMGRNATSADEFYVVDVTTPSAPSLLGSLEIGNSIRDLTVISDMAFATTNTAGSGLIVIDLTDNINPIVINQIDTTAQVSVAKIGSYTFVGDDEGVITAFDESFNVLDTLTIEGIIWGMEADETNEAIFVASSDGAQEIIVVNASTPSSLTISNSIDMSGQVFNSTLDLGTLTVLTAGGSNDEEVCLMTL